MVHPDYRLAVMLIVNASAFSIEKVSIEERRTKNITRKNIMYQYRDGSEGKENLRIALDAGNSVICTGIFDEKFGDSPTGRYETTLLLDDGNPSHMELYGALDKVFDMILEKETGKEVVEPVDLSQDGTKCKVFCKMVESRDAIRTRVYDGKKNDIDVKSMGRSLVRPSLQISYPMMGNSRINVRISVSEMLFVGQAGGSGYSLLES